MTVDESSEASSDLQSLRDALKRSASALKHDGVQFALGGSYALWVHGAPEPDHDVDLVVTEHDVPAAVDSLTAAGFRIERPPEDWLFKAYADEALVDVLHRLQGDPVDQNLIDTAQEYEVLGLRIPVLPPTEIITTKMLSLSEHYCDFGRLLAVVRAVREQLDWTRIRAATAKHPFAEAFLLLIDRLEIADLGIRRLS
ncbi:MAG TPA: nucleotidyltransferase [Propionibacteriaceae bacterium]|nr:nucleotidyltransferase [Propionibacteriaceae bacterium]